MLLLRRELALNRERRKRSVRSKGRTREKKKKKKEEFLLLLMKAKSKGRRVNIPELVRFHKLSTREWYMHKTNAVLATLSSISFLYFVLKD